MSTWISKPGKEDTEASREVRRLRSTKRSGVGAAPAGGGEVGLETGKSVENQFKRQLDIPAPSSSPVF